MILYKQICICALLLVLCGPMVILGFLWCALATGFTIGMKGFAKMMEWSSK